MLKASPAYLLGGASLLSTTIATVVNGVCYGSSRVSTPDNSFVEAVTVSLSIISCSVVVALVLILANERKIDARAPGKGWKATTYGTGIGYLSIATGVTAGGIVWGALQSVVKETDSGKPPHRQSLLVARCVLWAISVLTQGMLCGVLLTTIISNNRHNQWPNVISYELDTIPPSCRSETTHKGTSNAPSSITESQRPSLDTIPQHQPSVSSVTSRRSTRYSGRTLTQSDTKPTLVSYPESATTRTRADGYPEDPDGENSQSRSQQLQRNSSQIKRSLDSVMLRPSSILPSSTQSDSTKRPLPKLKLPDERNIHPLFRSDTRSPPPTTTPSTMVLASPDAGQTITVKALQRMRSTRSVENHTPQSRSPLLEQTDHLFEDMGRRPGSIMSCNNSRPGI
ncbi:hypothetical protein BDW62DRAFT_216332 [Aspergillus aurantiobrunneus]